MELLVSAGASVDVRVPMLLWGETMTWETIVFDSTPVTYAQCGLSTNAVLAVNNGERVPSLVEG
jgi:hypothetical protein